MSVIWGVPYLLIKVADGGVVGSRLVLARVAIGAAVLLLPCVRRGQIRVLARAGAWLLVFAVVEIIVPWALLSEAERHLSSSLTGLLIAVGADHRGWCWPADRRPGAEPPARGPLDRAAGRPRRGRAAGRPDLPRAAAPGRSPR